MDAPYFLTEIVSVFSHAYLYLCQVFLSTKIKSWIKEHSDDYSFKKAPYQEASAVSAPFVALILMGAPALAGRVGVRSEPMREEVTGAKKG